MAYFHTNSLGPDIEALHRALSKAAKLAKVAGTGRIIFAVHSKLNLDANTYANAFGEVFMKTLRKGSVSLADVTVVLRTERLRPDSVRGPLMAVHVSPKFLAELLDDRNVTDLIYVPWTDKDLDTFKQQCQAEAI